MEDGKRNKQPEGVGNAIDRLLESYQLKEKYAEIDLVDSWEEIVGKQVASKTKTIYLKDGKLFIEIISAPLKNELNYKKALIVEMVRKKFPNLAIQTVIFR
ncbi:MAG: DUF721 domain-containing protein [Cyclobacteriaceae bacterium]|nr:DUF721 domain-containing protein [Cyclobacteriaceae bacterium]